MDHQENLNQRIGKWLYASALLASVFTLGYMMLWSSTHDFNKFNETQIRRIVRIVTDSEECYQVQIGTTDRITDELLSSKIDETISPLCNPITSKS